jgi:hypothetical protein
MQRRFHFRRLNVIHALSRGAKPLVAISAFDLVLANDYDLRLANRKPRMRGFAGGRDQHEGQTHGARDVHCTGVYANSHIARCEYGRKHADAGLSRQGGIRRFHEVPDLVDL